MSLALLAALAAPAIAAMSDADAAAALNVPTYTPRTGAIGFDTLSGAGVWGFNKTAAFRMALSAAAASADPTVAAPAALLLKLLEGPGFFATDPQVPAMVPTFVALGGGTVSLDDGNLAIGIPTYAAGGPVAVADVTAARVEMSRQAAWAALNQLRFNADSSRGDKLTWLIDPKNSSSEIPSDLASLDAWRIPG